MEYEVNEGYNYSVDKSVNNQEFATIALFKDLDVAISFYDTLVEKNFNSENIIEIKLVKLEDCSIVKQYRSLYDN